MSFIPPYPFKCTKCGHVMQFMPKVVNLTVPVTRDTVHCPECWRAFLLEHVGVMKPYVNDPGNPQAGE